MTREAQRLIREAEKVRIEEVQAFVLSAFDVLINNKGYDLKEIANYTGLSLATVYRLNNGDCTDWVRFGTIQKLEKAAGLKLVVLKCGGRVTRPVC